MEEVLGRHRVLKFEVLGITRLMASTLFLMPCLIYENEPRGLMQDERETESYVVRCYMDERVQILVQWMLPHAFSFPAIPATQ